MFMYDCKSQPIVGRRNELINRVPHIFSMCGEKMYCFSLTDQHETSLYFVMLLVEHINRSSIRIDKPSVFALP